MNDPLSTYLNDHLAGAKFAIEMLERFRDAYANTALGALAAKLLIDINEDRDVLESINGKLGGGASVIKEAGAWLAEKTARMKLRLAGESELGKFEILEMLALGILGKMKLWQTLSEIAPFDSPESGYDLNRLIARAQAQHDEVEAFRRASAKATFVPSASKT